MKRIKKLLSKRDANVEREAQEAAYYFQIVVLVAAVVVVVLLAMYLPDPTPPVRPVPGGL